MRMINSLAIEKSERSFLPEAYAYKDFFKRAGVKCDFVDPGSLIILDYDAVLIFHGLHPFWRKYPKIIIAEYHTLSTGRLGRFKDFIKRVLNVRADITLFLNEDIRRKLWFKKNQSYLYRNMGVPLKEYDGLACEKKKYDVVYAGSFRDGVVSAIDKLASFGLSVAVVGFEYIGNSESVYSFGRMSPVEARRIIAQARFGLNLTPNIHPYNIQDSTKVLEYCAAGLGVITNRYEWINKFESEYKASFLDIKNITCVQVINSFSFVVPDIADRDWEAVINSSGLEKKLNTFYK
jgi:hypothetical protein